MEDIVIEESIEKIYNHLQLGTSIPILPEFKEPTLFALKNYGVKAILLKEKNENNVLFSKSCIVGISLLYSYESILYFGFFKIYDDDRKKIQKLIDTIISYAKEHNYTAIRGPVNIPTIIFGYGFMVEGSDTSTLIARSVDSPIYLELYNKNGFDEKFILDTYVFKLQKLNIKNIKEYQEMYDFLMVNNEGLLKYKDKFVNLHAEAMPEYSQITPNVSINALTILKHLFNWDLPYKLGGITFLKSSKEVISCGFLAPNPFNFHYINIEQIVIDKKYQGYGIIKFINSELMAYYLNLKDEDRPYYASAFVSAENERMSGFLVKYYSAWRGRRHIVLEYKLK